MVPIFGHSIQLEHLILDFRQRSLNASLTLISSTLTTLAALAPAAPALAALAPATFPLTRHVQASCHCPVLLVDHLELRGHRSVILTDLLELLSCNPALHCYQYHSNFDCPVLVEAPPELRDSYPVLQGSLYL